MPIKYWVTVRIAAVTASLLVSDILRAAETAKPATAATKAHNAAVLGQLPFDDKRDFDDAQRGFIAPLPNDGVVKNADGRVVFNGKQFKIPLDKPAPDSVNPSQWRQAQLNGISGLFKVVDRIYQVRGLDISNITFIEGDTGIIVVDPLISAENAKAALDLYLQFRPKKAIVAVIFTHSHIDHFGGVRGIVDDTEVKAARAKIIAPAGFTEEAVSENAFLGNAMSRRAMYQYGNLVPVGPSGTLGTGLGVGTSNGTITMLPPTRLIEKTGEKLTIDGLEFEFLLAPSSEAPSEMHFYVPAFRALCTAENAVHTLHNFYTLRGAKTRDASKWVGYLDESLDMWGDKAEVLFAPHSWPVWGNDRIVEHIENYRDTFRYIHDQSVRLANNGYSMNEIGDMIELPPALARNWATRGYYGSVSHNARAVYNFYLGYYSANPADLRPLPPAESAKRYVELMGGADKVLAAAQAAYDKGEYRWAAELLKQAVYADPSNQKARNLQADAFEQLGYQDENNTWRNAYLVGAKELRDGVRPVAVDSTASPDIAENMPIDLLFDYLAVRLNGPKAAEKHIGINFNFSDVKQRFAVTVKNGVLNHRRSLLEAPDATIRITHDGFNSILMGKTTLEKLVADKKAVVEGDGGKLAEMLSLVDKLNFWFNVVTPNPVPKD